MRGKKRVRSIALFMSICLLMMGLSVHAEEVILDVEGAQEEMASDAEIVQDEEMVPNEEVTQDEGEVSNEEVAQEEGVAVDSETEQVEEQTAGLEALQAEEAGIALADENSVQRANGLSLSVEYPSQIKCGEPTTFRMKAEGGSGNYKYKITDLSIYDGSERVFVYDISFGQNGEFKESNEFVFTFFASGTYYLRFSAIDMSNFQFVTTGLFDHVLKIEDSRYPAVDQLVNTIADQCLKECSTDFEKALWLHDWILDNADYDYSYSYCSAEGVLARGTGTCEAYHRAYVMLLNKVGIQTGRITGNGHVWTAVKMNGNWYQVDSTWDDKGENVFYEYEEHLYFGITDSIMGLVHSDHKAAVPGYESTALENNYFIYTGEISRWSDPFKDKIKQKIASGQTEFVLDVTDGMPDSYKNVIYNLVAYQLSIESWGDVVLSAAYSPENTQISCRTTKNDKPITKVSLNQAQVDLMKGDSSVLTATIEPADTTESKAIRWSTSNAAVATVVKGKVTAVSAGEVTITAEAGTGKSASCKITVMEKPITKVSLNKGQLALTEGEKGTLTATVEPSDTTDSKVLSWSSSNTKVATVANGMVTAVSAGEATITARAGNGKSAACKVTVTRKAKPITKVSLNKSQLTLTEGGRGTLTATVEPADTTDSKVLSWSSSNTKVATVANGTVTAVSAGEATITAKAGNGKSAACKVTVTRKAKPITKVSLNKSQLTLTEGGRGTLTATVEPADTTDSKVLSWSTSNAKVATVANGTVTAVSAGEATITAKAGNGKSAACKVTVTRKAKPITKVNLNKSQLTLTEGGKGTLSATVEPSDTTDSKVLRWSSSNTKVATVANGTVTAVSAGEATITAKSVNGKSVSCKVTVNKKETSTPKPPADTGTENQKPDNTPPRIFPDVNSGDWYQESAGFVSSRGIMTGMSDGRFGPSEKLSRAQFATILHRMAGTPEPAYNLEPFPDVPEGQFYTVASVWAKETGVISGYNDGRFGPSDNITREQMAVMMYRYAILLQLDVSERGDLSSFPDTAKISDFAWEALEWAVGKGLITGDQGNVNPRGTADRAQCATIIMRFMNSYGM